MEDRSRTWVLVDGNVLAGKPEPEHSCQQRSLGVSDAKPLTACKVRGGHRLGNRFGLKHIKVPGESASANEEAADPFPAEFKKWMKEEGYRPKQAFNCDETRLFW